MTTRHAGARGRRRLGTVVGAVAAVLAGVVLAAPAAQARPDCDRPNPPPVCLPPEPGLGVGGRLADVAVEPGANGAASPGLRVRGSATADGGRPVTVAFTVDGASRPERVTASGPFDVVLGGARRHSRVCAVASLDREVRALGCRADPRSVSVLDLNFAALEGRDWTDDAGTGTVEVTWRERIARLASWTSRAAVEPDVVLLQEWPEQRLLPLPFPRLDPNTYEASALLVERMNAATGRHYRIATYVAGFVPTGIQPHRSGLLIAYDADRWRNVTESVVGPPRVAADDETVTGTHTRSAPACASMPGWPAPDPAHCALLDGAGTYLTTTYVDGLAGGWRRPMASVVLESRAFPGRHVVLTDVHLGLDRNESRDGDRALRAHTDEVRALVRELPMVVPPIVAGDFNGGFDDVLPEFTAAASPPNPIDYVLLGPPSQYPSAWVPGPPVGDVAPASYRETLPGSNHCGAARDLLSDHCGVYAQLLP